MNKAVKDLLAQARTLTPEEQLDLAEQLIHETTPDVDAAWLAEAERRWASHQASGGRTYDAFDTIAEIRQRLRRPKPR